MSVDSTRKIHASYIEYDGDYVHIVRRPMKRAWLSLFYVLFLISVFFFDVIISLLIDDPESIVAIYIVIGSVIGGFALFAFDGNQIYTVPRTDISVIKEYPERERVTVIFDDERTKSRLFLAE